MDSFKIPKLVILREFGFFPPKVPGRDSTVGGTTYCWDEIGNHSVTFSSLSSFYHTSDSAKHDSNVNSKIESKTSLKYIHVNTQTSINSRNSSDKQCMYGWMFSLGIKTWCMLVCVCVHILRRLIFEETNLIVFGY